MKFRKSKPVTSHIKRLHRKHGLHHRTMFYMKEYGPGKDVHVVIVKESLKIILLTAIISTIGGIHLESIQSSLVTLMPLLIMLPAMNGMIGNYGAIISSRFTTALYLGQITNKWWKSDNMRDLFSDVLKIGTLSAVYISAMSSAVSYLKGFAVSYALLVKILFVSLICTLILVTVIFVISVTAGFYIYRKKEDPNNFLIPLTTAVADLGSMLIFAAMVRFLF
ncbi:MAG: magnesium transporter [Candidatus Aenigmarchaeota archaeon]|nr:magnesium transporter [Candidatus Aenigmarchaeota archaeon]